MMYGYLYDISIINIQIYIGWTYLSIDEIVPISNSYVVVSLFHLHFSIALSQYIISEKIYKFVIIF